MTRACFEPRFGQDFSDTRVHSGPAAQQSARDLNADAYTVGQDIVFGSGMLAPETQTGQRLLAHELAHVVQQQGSPVPVLQRQLAKDNDTFATGTPRKPSLDLVQYSAMCSGGCMTDDDLNALVESLKDPETKKLEADEKAANQKRKAAEVEADATRHDRLIKFRIDMNEKHYLPEDVRDMMAQRLSMRDMLVLKRFGFSYPTNLLTRYKVRKRIIEAIDAYDADWHARHQNTSEEAAENKRQDDYQAYVNAEAARARSAYDPEVAEAITGGIFGAIGYGIGGDEGAKIGATVDNLFTAAGFTAEARAANKAMSESSPPTAPETHAIPERPVETDPAAVTPDRPGQNPASAETAGAKIPTPAEPVNPMVPAPAEPVSPKVPAALAATRAPPVSVHAEVSPVRSKTNPVVAPQSSISEAVAADAAAAPSATVEPPKPAQPPPRRRIYVPSPTAETAPPAVLEPARAAERYGPPSPAEHAIRTLHPDAIVGAQAVITVGDGPASKGLEGLQFTRFDPAKAAVLVLLRRKKAEHPEDSAWRDAVAVW
jgi:hypothetical protein